MTGSAHLLTIPVLVGLALAAVVLVIRAVTRNRIIHRRLRFTLMTLVGLLVLHVASLLLQTLGASPQEPRIEQLLVALAVISLLVALLFNPWFQDRVPDRSPAIVQDALVVVGIASVAVFLLKDTTFLTASAIAAAAIGFALQDTLGNAFSGLAIQIEKPFRVGHWISVGNHEGTVTEVTWRATKLRTKAGNFVVVPNNVVAKEVINNYSEPAAVTRVTIDVGAEYGAAPNDVRAAVLAAMAQVPRVLTSPTPDVLLVEFAASAIVYRARFWIADFAHDEEAKDQVRRAVYYEFRRRRIEIPWPISVEYRRNEPPADSPERREAFARTIAGVPVLSSLAPEAHRALAAAASEHLFGDREVIVRQGDPGRSMFLIRRGRVAITIGPEAREVAVTEAGGYFGEMSLLTGEPRSATVTARGDCTVLEINADDFRAYVRSHPEVVDQLVEAAAARRREIDETLAASGTAPAAEATSLGQRIRRFFGLAD
jgi:small-conductance mechanosensitive channel/CRP-like cAMP-binding protein